MSNPLPSESQPQPLSDFELDLLKQEYFFLQNTIEDYNKQIWVIKAIGITGTGGVLALMLQQKTNASAIALIGCTIPLFSGFSKVSGNTFSVVSIPALTKSSLFLPIHIS
ncbi:hypothetical protein [Anabaena azotica]|uniref:hypothetical protein n=1 Tax=Anabaena azotica TaxID=197653 RepID=UPI001F555396|nr:hypothetical protein [Anabaena azotica]